MHPDEEPQLKISKLPFYVGDGLLVATALAIAILGDWQLTDMQVAYCVVAVALGAALTCLPFVVEYFMRAKEQSEDRTAEMELLKKHLAETSNAFEQVSARFRDLEARLSANGQADEVVVAAVDQKLAVVEQLREQVQAVRSDFEGKLTDLEKAIPAPVELVDPAVLTGLEQSVAELRAKLDVAQQDHVDLEPLMLSVERIQTMLDQHTDQLNKLESIDQEAQPKRVTRGRPAKKSLLHRAINEKQDVSAKAVKRIIRAKKLSSESESESDLAAEKQGEQNVTVEPVAELEETEEILAPESVVEEPMPEPEPEPEVDVMIEGLGELMEIEDDAIEAELAKSEAEPEAQEAPAAADGEGTSASDLFGEAPATTVSPKRKSRTKKKDAVLTVSILIGIGNKPFLRGSAAGLTWEQGIEMDFQEIGKWRWVAPEDLDEPIEVQIYRNDEDPDLTGKYTLEPGQKLELSPKF